MLGAQIREEGRADGQTGDRPLPPPKTPNQTNGFWHMLGMDIENTSIPRPTSRAPVIRQIGVQRHNIIALLLLQVCISSLALQALQAL